MFGLCPETPQPGFSFANFKRNALLESKGFPLPGVTKTGTTIVGIIYKDGVILGADSRATDSSTIVDKNCRKIHYIADNIYCCGAGTAADTEQLTQMIVSQLELHRLYTKRRPRIVTAKQMMQQYLFRYQGGVAAAMILGGVDSTGFHLYSIYPYGSVDKLPYASMGSGCWPAISVFETNWKEDLEEDEGVKLVRDAVVAGVFNDLGSGSNVDVCIIRRGTVDYCKAYEVASKKGKQQNSYQYPKGTTDTLSTRTIDLVNVAVHHIEEEEV